MGGSILRPISVQVTLLRGMDCRTGRFATVIPTLWGMNKRKPGEEENQQAHNDTLTNLGRDATATQKKKAAGGLFRRPSRANELMGNASSI
jgi:hypothetical protein